MLLNLALIGYRGTGKSSVAQRLAGRWGWNWIDADDVAQARAGQTIAQLFATSGEAAFRDLEAQILAELVTQPRVVLATGGGAVLRADNREALRRAGGVIWLTAAPEVLLARLTADERSAPQRPRLTDESAEQEIRRLVQERQPWYAQCATWTVATDALSPEEVADAIEHCLGTANPGGPG